MIQFLINDIDIRSFYVEGFLTLEMHLTVRSTLLIVALYYLYLPAIARVLSNNELVIRAEVVDLDPTIDDTTGAKDDGTTAATGTQDTSSDTSTGMLPHEENTSLSKHPMA